jgi:hypothetical protein
MTVHKPVGLGASITIAVATATLSNPISVQSKVLRISASGSAVCVAIGTNPTATATDYYLLSGNSASLALSPASQRVVGIVTGTSTTITFPEGTGSPFVVGDYVTLTSVGQSYYNFTHQPVTAVDASSGVGGYYSTRITVSTSTSGILTAFTAADGDLRKSVKISSYGVAATAGVLYYQQVQIAGDA